MTSLKDNKLPSKNETCIGIIHFRAKDKVTKKDFLGTIKAMRGPEPDEKKLLTSVSVNNIMNVERLLKAGVSANSSDKIGRSALHLAASKGYTDMVQLLLEHGANPNSQDVIQNTPLHLAACSSNLSIVTMLINSGANILSLDMHGRNPLQLAESKLKILKSSWSTGAIELVKIRSQVEEIVDVMISLWTHKDRTSWGHHRDNIDDLQLMKLSLNTEDDDKVDDQMNKLLTELQEFSIK